MQPASDWAMGQDHEVPFSEILDAFNTEFYSPVHQNREDAIFNTTDYPMFPGQRIYEFASYWIERLWFNRVIPTESKFEKLCAKLPTKYEEYLERAYHSLVKPRNPSERE